MPTSRSTNHLFAILAFTLLMLQAVSAQSIWNGASGTDFNWSTTGNWTGGAVPGATDDVKFYDDGADFAALNVNNIADSLFGGTILSLQYAQSNLLYHTTQIDAGQTLTVRGSLIVSTEAIADQNVDAAITGPGTLVVSNTAADMIVRQGGNGTSRRATLDMSGLDTFVVQVDQLVIGRADPPGLLNINRNTGWLYLAKTNRIRSASTAATSSAIGIEVGRSGSNNGNGSRLYLGQSNSIFATSLSVGMEKETGCQMLFNSIFTDSAAYIRGSDGASRVSLWTVGDGEANSGTTSCQGTCDFTGGTVDALVDTMTLGRASANASGTGNSRGTLTMASGTMDVNTLQAGLQTVSSGKNGNGTINVNGGTLIVNNVLGLGTATGGAGVATTLGTLNINSGTVQANAIATGATSGGSTINVTAGTLILTNTAGTADASLGDVSLSDATLILATVSDAPRVVVTNLTTGGAGNTIQVGLLPAITAYPAQFRLIDYQGYIGGADFNFTLAGLAAPYSGFLSNNVADTAVDLVISSGPVAQPITWVGSVDGTWDTSLLNWRVGAAPTNFFGGDFVTFDDTATGTTTINLPKTVSPGSVVVDNSTLSYTFTGSGIGGLGGLTKQGSGTLVLNNTGANTFAGPTEISGGTLRVGNGGTTGGLGAGSVNNNAALIFDRSDPLTVGNTITGSAAGSLIKNGAGTLELNGANAFDGPVSIAEGILKTGNNAALGSTSGATTISSGATLDVGANNINLGQEQFLVSGAGVNGQGAIINSSGSGSYVGPNVARVTMTGDTTFGGTGRWDMRSSNTANPAGATLSTGGQPYKITKVGPNGVYLPGVTVDPALGDVDVQEGTLAIESGTTGIGDPAYTLTVQAGAMLQLYNMTNLLNKKIVLNGSGTNNTVNNAGGNCTVIGPMTLSGDCIFNAGGTSLTLNNTIGGTGSLIKVGGSTLTLAGGPHAYNGNTTVSNGTLVVNTELTGGGTVTTVAGTTLAGNGATTGLVSVGGALQPGAVAGAGTFTCGPLTLEAGASLTLDLSAVTTVGGGVNDLVQVNGNLTANNNPITINLLQGGLQAGTYRLLTYTGTLTGHFDPTVLVAGGASRFSFTLDTATAGQVNLIVSGSSANLRWASVADSTWDIATSANWFNLGTSQADTFYQADTVLLDDASGVLTDIQIPAGVAVVPTVITNRSEANYFAVGGAGKISGGASIVKQGSSTLTLGSANDFTGTVTVEAGTLLVTNNTALGSVDGETIIKSGATLDLGNPNVAANAVNLGLEPITVSGNGQFDGGAIVNSSALAQQNAVRVVTLAGNISFGGNARWDIRGTGAALSTGGNAYNITKIGVNQVSLVGVAVDPALGNVDVQGGIFSIETSTTSLGNPARTLTIESGATLQLYQLAVALDKVIVLNGDGATTTCNNSSGNNAIAGPVTLAGSCLFNVGGTSLTLNGAVGGTGSLVKNGTSVMTLAAASPYAGDTLVNAGTLALVGVGAIAGSPTIALANATSLDASGRVDATLALGGGQTLLGHGTVRGSLQVNPGATLSPGNDADATSIGRLTVTSSVVFAGTNVMQTDKFSLTNDVVGGAASVTFGGTLRIKDLYDQPYMEGDSFKLFDAASYSGAFAAILPARPADGLYWDTRELTTSGTLKVVSTPPPASPPTITGITRSGNNIVVNGVGGQAGAEYRVLSAADVALPRSNWTPVSTNTFLGDGSFVFTNAMDVGTPQRFFLIQLP